MKDPAARSMRRVFYCPFRLEIRTDHHIVVQLSELTRHRTHKLGLIHSTYIVSAVKSEADSLG